MKQTVNITIDGQAIEAREREAELIRDEADLAEFLKLAPYHIVIEPLASARVVRVDGQHLLVVPPRLAVEPAVRAPAAEREVAVRVVVGQQCECQNY